MFDDAPEPVDVPGLAPGVVALVLTELAPRGENVVRCLRTAAALLEQACEDVDGLRLAESAAYNLRQAFDMAVEDQEVLPRALTEVTDAWERYEIAVGARRRNSAQPVRRLGSAAARRASRSSARAKPASIMASVAASYAAT